MPHRPWTKSELDRVHAMRAAGHPYGEIDKALGRRAGSAKLRLEGHSVMGAKSTRVLNNLLVERDALAAARDRSAPTQHFFGDPPPGYSALYGKTGLR